MGSSSTPVVIMNPASNSGRTARLRPMVEQKLAGGRGELVLTERPRHGEEIGREAAKSGRPVIVVGGDGSLAEVANGVLSAQQPSTVPLGLVGAGNGNDYAWQTLKLPRDPAAALEVALTGEIAAMDAGQVNGRFFINSLSIGLDANIAAAAESLKRYPFLKGQMLYQTASMREILFHYDKCPWLTAFPDDDQPVEGKLFALSAVSVGPTYGGGFRINPLADPRDGLFDLCMIVKPSKLRALQLVGIIKKGEHVGLPEVSLRRVKKVVLESREPAYAQLDGEVIQDTRFEVDMLPGALQVRVPKAS